MIGRSTEKAILGAAFFLALSLHIGAFLLIKDFKIDSSLPHTKSLWENQQEKEVAVQDKELIENKNKELAEIFKEINRPKEPKDTLHFDTKNIKSEFYSPNFEQTKGELSLNEEELPAIKEDSFKESVLIDKEPNQLLLLDPNEKLSQVHKQNRLDVFFPPKSELTEELIRATEMGSGKVDALPIENLETDKTFQVGPLSEGSSLGTSFQNRSGLIDQGKIESSLSSSGTLLFLNDNTAPTSNSLIQIQKYGQEDVALPGINKDALRGFETSTLGAIASSDDFNLEVEYAPSPHGQGVIFKLELKPKPGVRFKRIAQNYFFLIDRSHSIPKLRYEITKQAVDSVLDLLQAGDTFNVLLFDDKIVPLAQENLAWNSENLEKAHQFLSKQHYGAIFATTDLYSSLGKIIPSAVVDQEVNTALLISDGDTYLSSDKQRDTIANWTRQNSGKVTLYSLASGKGNNLALLDLLSVFNKGALFYSTSDKGIETGLSYLLNSIKNPIGKDISLSTVSTVPGTQITLYPPNTFLPNLYENTPFVIYGTINKASDFHVFFQGRYYDKFLDIKQAVSFTSAKQVDGEKLEKNLAKHEAYKKYEKYLQDGNKEHLAEAKKLLQSYRIPVAFQ